MHNDYAKPTQKRDSVFAVGSSAVG